MALELRPGSIFLYRRLARFFVRIPIEQVERIDRQPFTESQRLPEIAVPDLPEDLRELADQINRLRDQLDALLYGFQDYGMVGYKTV